MADWSAWTGAGSFHVNSFGSSSQFWLNPIYRYKREGNTVYYEIHLDVYYKNTATYGGSGTYGYPIGTKINFNESGGSDSTNYYRVTDGGSWSAGAGASTLIGYSSYSYSVTNTGGTGSIPVKVYCNNESTGSFDNPGWYTCYFAIPAMDYYTVSYNANGGTGAPQNQIKQYNVPLDLTTETPSHAQTFSNTYTVTYNGNGGAVDRTSDTSSIVTTYNFVAWNTNADGTGTWYSPGAKYTANANLSLYAGYNQTTERNSIVFPGGSRTGYIFKGFGTSSSSTTPIAAPYTPTGNVTLYAIWEAKKPLINIKNNSSWVGASTTKVKVNNAWYQAVKIYNRLDYIESTGLQGIDTYYNHKTNSTKYEMSFELTALSNPYQTLFGSRITHDGNEAYYLGLTSTGSSYGCIGGTKKDPLGWTAALNTRYNLTLDPINGLTVNGTNYPIAYTTATTYTGSTDSIFGFFTEGRLKERIKMKLYSFKIYEGSTLKRDFVPCCCGITVGLYDLVEKKFHPNIGTSYFTKGNYRKW